MKSIRGIFTTLLLTLAACITAGAGEIEGPKGPVPADQYVEVRYKLEAGDDIIWSVKPKPAKMKQFVHDGYSYCIFNGPTDTKYEVEADYINWNLKKRSRPTCDVVIGKAAPPTPEPIPPAPDPKPKPDPPAPGPVTSFRVFLVYESGATLTAAQNSVLYGKETVTVLDAATAGDKSEFGWRRFDRDQTAANDGAGFKAVWDAVRAEIKPAQVPCVVFQVNDKITIESLPATPAALAELVKKYRGK